jgi:hypothetical protein
MKEKLVELGDSTLRAVSRALPKRLMHHWSWVLLRDKHIADAWGISVRPIHYYEPLPDFRTLTQAKLEIRRVSPGIDFAMPAQISLLETLATESRAELDGIAQEGDFDFANTLFTGLDACAYYALIRHLRPKRITEIGSGYSTQIASRALARNEVEGSPFEIICIEPYPEARLTKSNAHYRLIQKPVQEVPLATFEELSVNDILMIDSSHVAKTGSDVCYEFLEILPRLKPGVWVHVHDIFFPQDYPPEWVIDERRAYNEQYFLEALLSGNKAFNPKLANHWLVLDHRELVDTLCPPAATRDVPRVRLGSSFWMCKGQ